MKQVQWPQTQIDQVPDIWFDVAYMNPFLDIKAQIPYNPQFYRINLKLWIHTKNYDY